MLRAGWLSWSPRLTVVNDGVESTTSGHRPGTGLASLTARTTALGGCLTTHTHNARFHLTARIPLAPTTAAAAEPAVHA